ncbi:hypothetical protein [Actinoplanes sp. TFC3]|uniref:hypothetical protein n=1 Tax=Actinoplanes sp. TFC3 TaxID=1710355 RepID=UPI00082B331B|nr:hypothetical protein [Actinoplanes sp. TFC3]
MGFAKGSYGRRLIEEFVTAVDANHDNYARYDRHGTTAVSTATPWGGRSGLSPTRVFWLDAAATSTSFKLEGATSTRTPIVVTGTQMADLVLASGALRNSRSGLASVVVVLGSNTAKDKTGSGYDLLVRLRQFGFTGQVYGATGSFRANPSAGSLFVGEYRRFGVEDGKYTRIKES